MCRPVLSQLSRAAELFLMNELTHDEWRGRARSVKWDLAPFIGGRLQTPHSTRVFEKSNPATGNRLCDLPVGHEDDINDAVLSANKTFHARAWSGLGAGSRKASLLALAQLMKEHAAELALFDSLEMGKPISLSLFEVLNFAIPFAQYFAEATDKFYGRTALTGDGVLAYNFPEPRGVVGAIVPWNFPVVNAVIKLFPALAAGNSVVLKPSEFSSGSALRLAELAMEAGIPEGTFNVVPGLGPTVGEALARHENVDLITFTGSTATGKRLMELSGLSNGKPLMLECGGKSPNVIFADTSGDMEEIAAIVAEEALWNQGQVCVARSRVIVAEEIKADFIAALASVVARKVPGDPLDPATDFGPVASAAQSSKIRSFLDDAQATDGKCVAGGGVVKDENCFLSPSVYVDPDSSSRLWREEIFGPVICVKSFKDKAEALALANDTAYGLAATIWTRDLPTALSLSRQIKAGEITIRTSPQEGEGAGFSLGQEPKGASGFGVEVGVEGLKPYTTLKKIECFAREGGA